MRVAYTGWTWLIHHDDNHKWEFEQFLKEVTDLGYEAVENFSRLLPSTSTTTRMRSTESSRKYGQDFVCLYHHYSERSRSGLSEGSRVCKIL